VDNGAPTLGYHHVGKVFSTPGREDVIALADVSFDIASREFVCLLGPSGCGKSTLLNLAAGFEDATTGQVIFLGKEVTGPAPERGVVFQDSALFPWMTVMDNLTFGPRMNGMTKKEAERIAREQLGLVGLHGFEDHFPAELSGGMQQRVQIARVLIMQPRLMLMDEPFGALDAQTRMLMQQSLTDLWEQFHQAVQFITHDVEESIFLADTIYVMTARPGRIKRRIDVGLPRPRSYELTMSAEFNEMKREILELIREESLHREPQVMGQARRPKRTTRNA
jgi:NitT/TauT family transport system ATP-binding protein